MSSRYQPRFVPPPNYLIVVSIISANFSASSSDKISVSIHSRRPTGLRLALHDEGVRPLIKLDNDVPAKRQAAWKHAAVSFFKMVPRIILPNIEVNHEKCLEVTGGRGAATPTAYPAQTLQDTTRHYKTISGTSLKDQLIARVCKSIGAFSSLKVIYIVSGLPKTRSDKIMRRLVRKILASEQT